jgi:hypothetical protein
MSLGWIRTLFVLAGLYDGLLGLAFLLGHERIFAHFGVEPANHPAYIEFPAMLLITFGLMFLHISTDPARLRPLMPYGMALKVSYVALALWYQFTIGIPSMWMPWAWMDLLFLLAFVVAWRSVPAHQDSVGRAH